MSRGDLIANFWEIGTLRLPGRDDITCHLTGRWARQSPIPMDKGDRNRAVSSCYEGLLENVGNAGFSRVHMSKEEQAAGTAVGVVMCCCRKGSIYRPLAVNGHSACGCSRLGNCIEAVEIVLMSGTCFKFTALVSIPMHEG